MIKVNGIELELISDNDMYLFLEKEVRGGMSYIAKRYSKDNNKYMKLYNSKPKTDIMYLDANNLHGSAMSQYLCYSEFI